MLKRKARISPIGRPFKHPLWIRMIAALIKLRLDLPYRALEIMTGMDAVTLHRATRRISALLADCALPTVIEGEILAVDSTGTRVRSTDLKDHSGHKHHKRRKCQIVTTQDKRIVAVSKSYAGSVHDKTIWNASHPSTARLKALIVADKAYAGGTGEGQGLFRPVKRNEVRYHQDKDEAKRFNRALSKQRIVVEHVFAEMKVFRVLAGLFPFKPDRYGEIFRAIAVLHNANKGCF